MSTGPRNFNSDQKSSPRRGQSAQVRTRLQMGSGLRRRPRTEVTFFLGRFGCGAVRIGRRRGLRFYSIQKRLRWWPGRTFVRWRRRANHAAVHILVTLRVDPFAFHVIPAFPQRRDRTAPGGGRRPGWRTGTGSGLGVQRPRRSGNDDY